MKLSVLIIAYTIGVGNLVSAGEDHLVLIPKPVWNGETISIVQIPLISGFEDAFGSYCKRIGRPYFVERMSPHRRDVDDQEEDVNPVSIAGIRMSAKMLDSNSEYEITIDYTKVEDGLWIDNIKRIDSHHLHTELLRAIIQCVYQCGDITCSGFKARFILLGVDKESDLHAELAKCVEERARMAGKAEPAGTVQPATRSQSKSEGSDKLQHGSEGRSR
jgi:hypothetical protein